MPEPGGADLLVGTERGGEGGRDRGGLEPFEVFQRLRAAAPGGGRLIIRGEGFEHLLELGYPGGGYSLGATRGCGRGGAAGERRLGLGEAVELFGRKKVYLLSVLDEAASGGERGAEFLVADLAGGDADGDDELARAGVLDLGLDLGGGEDGGMFLEVGREVGVEARTKGVLVGSEKVQDLVAVSQPPFSCGGIEHESVGRKQFAGGGVGGVFPGRQGDGQIVFAAVDGERGKRLVAGREARGAHGERSRAGAGRGRRGGLGGRRRREVLADAAKPRADPKEVFVGFGQGGENRLAHESGDEFAELGAGDLDKRGRGGGAIAKAREQGEGRQLRGGRRHGAVQLHLQRDGVATGGFGKVGRQE